MLDEPDLESLRAMTPGQRVELGIGLPRLAWAMLDVPDAEAGRRKWELYLRQQDDHNQRVLAGLARERPLHD